ncbi:hypothetical protein NSK_007580 [Nannochloropsis salina CCMP1776]|uniref:Uncharacterized protein n=1 Tax=Nannochloropsis salina CCMP1776 TaxID=1027361 RepID=A0A4D9CS91_9STRA|nr:hypothetical protein NSK_007580 [Nannochloropsis salina CCMP1776]|eukprot:TFJ80937.1 hypothetical protein NSK_007580 [Nannochloropsis salina CCMP1776]
MKTAVLLASVGCAQAFVPQMNVQPSFLDQLKNGVSKALPVLVGGSAFLAPSISNALTKEDLSSLSYLQVKGTGLANRCPEVVGEGSIALQGGKTYQLSDLCLEPKTWQVEEEVTNKRGETTKSFVNTKLMTRQTYSLDGVSGDISVGEGGKIKFEEKDGIDYAATTIQLPGGERVPFLFTIKELVATAAQPGNALKPGFQFGGSFKVPSYRSGLFLDPKGRGAVTGYDMAVALPGLQNSVEGDEELFKENNKIFDVTSGNIELEVNKVNVEEGEVGGVFVSTQFSDTDMGSKAPKKLLMKGIFYGRLAQ